MCSLKRDWPLMHFFAQRTLNSLLSFYSLTFRETWHIFSYCKLIKMKLLHACSATIKETFMISQLLLLLLCLTSWWNGMHFSKEEVVQCDTLEPFILLISALLHPSGEDGAFKASWAPRNWWTSQNGKMEMQIYWTHFFACHSSNITFFCEGELALEKWGFMRKELSEDFWLFVE